MEDKDSIRQNSDVAVIGVSRHRMGTDGNGITTLVAFQGCLLRCKYCLNKKCWESEDRFKHYTPQSLYDEIKVDDLYFRATSGGVTFGGGEPCLKANFIVEFRRLCGSDWKIRVETSLNVAKSLIEKLAPVVDEWIIDTKSRDNEVYKEYTGVNRKQMIDNLDYLVSIYGLNIPKNRIYLRVPVIPGFVDEEEAQESRQMFENAGFKNVEVFEYITEKDENQANIEGRGKLVCELLKVIRREVASSNGVKIAERDCDHKGECSGTCPLCEKETAELIKQLNGKNISVSKATLDRTNGFDI